MLSFATPSGVTLLLIECMVPYTPKILCRTYSIVLTTQNVAPSHHEIMNEFNKIQINKQTSKTNDVFSPSHLHYCLNYTLLWELVFICLQNINNSDAVYPLPNCLDGLKAAVLFKFHSFLFKTSRSWRESFDLYTLLQLCPHVS